MIRNQYGDLVSYSIKDICGDTFKVRQVFDEGQPEVEIGSHGEYGTLSRDHVAALLPLLQRFVDTGSIEEVGA